MKQAEISKTLQELIPENHRINAAIFTTYSIELDFLELDVIPLLLSDRIAYSPDEQIKQFQVSEALREYDQSLEVFCDWRMFQAGEARSPQMGYLCHPVNLGNKAFHPKVIWLLSVPIDPEDTDSQPPQLMMAVGSNNLTRAGWWENIEVQHWETIGNGTHSREFLDQVLQDLRYLNGKRGVADADRSWIPEHQDAVTAITAFADQCTANDEAPSIWYYGIDSRDSVPAFLAKHLPDSIADNLEIVSPFFAEDDNNELEKDLFPHRDARIILPLEDDGQEHRALCTRHYLNNVDARDGIQWATWAVDVATESPQKTLRTLHAKLFHFRLPSESWLLAGSVNFTRKALYENAEAAFLLRKERQKPLLKSIDHELPEVANTPLDAVPGAEEAAAQTSDLVQAHVTFDWQLGEARIFLEKDDALKDRPLQIELKDGSAQPLFSGTLTTDETTLQKESTSALQQHLKNSGFVTVSIQSDDKLEPQLKATLNLLVYQLNWVFKPRQIPKLTAQEILAIYAGLPAQQQQNLIQQAQARLVLAQYGSTEYTEQGITENPYNEFFCEYAQIFESFDGLADNMQRYFKEQPHQLDYYLTGPGVDSLPTLINAAVRTKSHAEKPETPELEHLEASPLPGVSAYLILLSASSLLKQYKERPGVTDRIDELEAELTKLKASDRLQIDQSRRKDFFRWFEKMFSTPVAQPAEAEDSES